MIQECDLETRSVHHMRSAREFGVSWQSCAGESEQDDL